jgi:hypothetical protein
MLHFWIWFAEVSIRRRLGLALDRGGSNLDMRGVGPARVVSCAAVQDEPAERRSQTREVIRRVSSQAETVRHSSAATTWNKTKNKWKSCVRSILGWTLQRS